MRTGVEIHLGLRDRERLEAVVASRNSPQKHVWRSRIVLLSADGIGTMEIQRRTGKAKPTIWRWQQRFMEAGVGGLLRDATRPWGSNASWRRVWAASCAMPPGPGAATLHGGGCGRPPARCHPALGQQGFMEAGVGGLLRDATRPWGSNASWRRVWAASCAMPPGPAASRLWHRRRSHA